VAGDHPEHHRLDSPPRRLRLERLASNPTQTRARKRRPRVRLNLPSASRHERTPRHRHHQAPPATGQAGSSRRHADCSSQNGPAQPRLGLYALSGFPPTTTRVPAGIRSVQSQPVKPGPPLPASRVSVKRCRSVPSLTSRPSTTCERPWALTRRRSTPDPPSRQGVSIELGHLVSVLTRRFKAHEAYDTPTDSQLATRACTRE